MTTNSSAQAAVSGKVALVTGASSGIGRATALSLAKAGAIVVCTARRESLLAQITEQCQAHSPECSYIAGDIGQREFAEGVVEQTIARYGQLDILINNAAVPMHRNLYEISAHEAEAVMRVNFLSCLWTTFAALPQMLLQGEERAGGKDKVRGEAGIVVNVSSFAATVTPTFETVYAASKAAMNGFSRGLWNDLAGSGVHCALVVPGPIDTEIWDKFDDAGAYSGKKYPAQLVADEILLSIRKRRYEVTVPQRNPSLVSARLVATFFPALIRKGVARMNPVATKLVDEAVARARQSRKPVDR
ncbi:MAG: SDR family oxidoreductase [Halioglobus sp.]